MIDELEWVRRERPDVAAAGADARAAARAALEKVMEAERPRRRRLPAMRPLAFGRLAPVVALLVVIAVVAVFLGVQTRKPSSPASRGATEFVFRAEPTAGVPVVTHADLARAVSILRLRLAQLPSGSTAAAQPSGTSVVTSGNTITIHLSSRVHIAPARLLTLVGGRGVLAFYDWEGNALTPGGKTAARLLSAHDPTALEISQGGSSGPGSAGAGSLSLYEAVTLAARQPRQVSADNARPGAEFFAFGARSSPACAAAARDYRAPIGRGKACYLAGPTRSEAELDRALPNGVSLAEAQVLTVEPGTVVLQAVPPRGLSHALAWSDPRAQFYVLKDHPTLSGLDITDPRSSTDAAGSPDVAFGFTSGGARKFQAVTARLAHRGNLVSGLGQTLPQHFAVALDTQLITVPSIDFRSYPDGVPANNGADITGGFTKQAARNLAAQLRLGPLPVALRLISP